MSPYQRKLLVFLSVATFFEGYDFIALTQLLPQVRADLHLSIAGSGWLVSFVNLGTVIAYFLVRRADGWGRKKLLVVTITGYTICTAASGLAQTVWDFGAFQFLARVFLVAEWAASMVLAAEEFPAAKRGTVIGLIQAFSSLGAILCAGVVVPRLLHTGLGWRAVYFVGIVPLVLISIARRSLRESARFTAAGPAAKRDLFHVFRTPYRKRVLQIAVITGLTYACTQNAITFWKEFVMRERGLDNDQVGKAIAIAAIGSLLPLFFTGKLLDWLGRRKAAILIFLTLSASVIACYQLRGIVPLTVALAFAMFGTSGVLPVLNAFTAELFPTDLRGDAFAWSNNLLGRMTYVLSPIAITQYAETHGFSSSMTAASLLPVGALVLILAWLPETTGRELEDTAALH